MYNGGVSKDLRGYLSDAEADTTCKCALPLRRAIKLILSLNCQRGGNNDQFI